jgi:phosphoserine aminotransferase
MIDHVDMLRAYLFTTLNRFELYFPSRTETVLALSLQAQEYSIQNNIFVRSLQSVGSSGLTIRIIRKSVLRNLGKVPFSCAIELPSAFERSSEVRTSQLLSLPPSIGVAKIAGACPK